MFYDNSIVQLDSIVFDVIKEELSQFEKYLLKHLFVSNALLLLLFAPNVKGKWVDSNIQIIDLLVPPRAAGVAGTLIIFVHIANFATLQPWLPVGSFTCRILSYCIRTRDPYFYVPFRDTELCD